MKRVLPFGPILFALVLITLTIVEYDFLLSLGWHPIHDPTFDWPSGLALGRFGWIMTATFIVSGMLMTMLGIRLFLDFKPAPASKAGSTLMMFAGLALAALSFTTDPTIRDTPSTWHGRLHDLSFVLLGLTLFPAMIALGFAFRSDEKWRNLSLYTWGTLALAAPAFALKGAAFYVFLFAILVWNEVVAIWLNRYYS
ncbi:MAG: DUF998 domain-containing protein [Anaerolineales bacterium]|nr:MAG: DUF998 domain-containing protein [Anaerolineales bacterium]